MLKRILLACFLWVPTVASANAPMQPSRYVNYNGLNLAVYESAGHEGPGILMVHGNTSAADSYTRVFETAFARHFRIVAMDMPGYGHSDNAPSYNAALLAGAIVKVAQTLHLEHGVMVGWSLGGDFMLQAAGQLPQARGFFLFGTAPVGYAPDLPPPFLSASESYAGPAVNYGAIGALTNDQISDYVRAFFRPNYAPIPNFFFQDGFRTDPGTRNAVFAAVTGQDPTFQDEVAIVKSLTRPVALLVGSDDAFVRRAYLEGLAPQVPALWHHQATVVNHSGHAVHWERVHQFVSLLRRFVNDCR